MPKSSKENKNDESITNKNTVIILKYSLDFRIKSHLNEVYSLANFQLFGLAVKYTNFPDFGYDFGRFSDYI